MEDEFSGAPWPIFFTNIVTRESLVRLDSPALRRTNSPSAFFILPAGLLSFFTQVLVSHNTDSQRGGGSLPYLQRFSLSVSGSEHGLLKTPEYVHSNLTGHLVSSEVFNNHFTIRQAISSSQQVNTCEQRGGVSFVSSLQINYWLDLVTKASIISTITSFVYTLCTMNSNACKKDTSQRNADTNKK